MAKVKVYPDNIRLARVAAEFFVTTAQESIEKNGRFSVALSGGSTPENLYILLGTDTFAPRVDWQHVHVFWGDERTVQPHSIDSNYRMVHDSLLKGVGVPDENIHRLEGELEPQEAADRYEATLKEHFGDVEFPNFDLIFLGLGADGHTASLFPNTDALQITDRWVAPNYVEELRTWRLTLTYPTLNAAHNILMLVSGEAKAETAKDILENDQSTFPAKKIQPTDGQLVWLLDEEAASLLDR